MQNLEASKGSAGGIQDVDACAASPRSKRLALDPSSQERGDLVEVSEPRSNRLWASSSDPMVAMTAPRARKCRRARYRVEHGGSVS